MSLAALDQNYVMHTYARRPLAFVKGRGAVLSEQGGREYIDFTSGIGVVSVGHGHPKLTEAIAKQAGTLIHTSNLYLIEPQARLAKELVHLSGLDARCFFANSGAEANEGAIKIARRYGKENGLPKRYKIITLAHSFHGRTITALKATGQEQMHNYFGPYPDGFVYAKDLEQIESLIDNHTVAVMIELVQGEGGVTPLDREQVQKLAQMLRRKDILLIIDEVQTGIYRTGELLACDLYDIRPDIITLAKGLAGGVPIGAIMTTHKNILQPGDHGSTFGGNFLSSEAALAVLEILKSYHESGELAEAVTYFKDRSEAIAGRFENLFEGETGLGLMRALIAKDETIQQRVIDAAHEAGLLILKSGRCRVRMLPPVTISKAEIDEGFSRLENACRSL
jgi:acetylornithine aminotransferase